ncbi:hypothetical protein CEP54_012402 [Fusarium duplospermum]|uniref:1,3-beta-D-glucan-UDP glucosyltransferase n=1 Tax=Fusarium duplospermum TaxID=1325734 RepID=A0A428P938_9HYPO|nr:hypothetical protein CEP54_012402 [Fusarium duplospermum]
MSAATGKSHASPSTDAPPPKRRSIRKGTRSCWECKRRKARCTFENVSDTSCIGCSRRGSTCVSQEYPEETSQARQSGERRREHFARIGKMVVQIVREEAMAESNPEMVNDWKPEMDAEAGADRLDGELGTLGGVQHPAAHIMAQIQESIGTLPSHSCLDITSSKPINEPGQAGKIVSSGALPTPRDIAGVSQSMNCTSAYFMNIMILPYSQLQLCKFKGMEVQDLHAPEVHPILKAKRMLTLATNIQSLQPQSHKVSGQLSAPPATLVQQLMKAATCIGNRTYPVVFIEELECLMLEAVILANGGHLQRAWLVFRRLVADAQLMGIHRRQHSAKALDPNNNLNTRFFWFRILYTERLLSLLLGLPQASTDCTMGDEAALLMEEHPVGRLERMHCVIASKLLQRNEMETNYDQETRNIDLQIQRAAQSMPTRWWLAPNLAGISDDAQGFGEMMRLANQLFHHFLIIQLHLPYMLRPTASSNQRASMTTCVNSSREVMVRFISFRSIQSVAFYCRAIDFFALIASVTLLLAHIDSHQNNEGESLAHQRPTDRALIEQAMEYMDDFNKASQDVLSKRSADIPLTCKKDIILKIPFTKCSDGFGTDGNYSYQETSARYGDDDTGSYYWQDGQTYHHAGGENNGWNDGYRSRDDVEQYSATSSEIFFGADDSAAYDGEDIDYPPVVHSSPDPYPAWASDPQQPLTTEEIEDTFLQLTEKLGFQRESMRNMFDHLMILLDSRVSRMSAEKALVSLHADYIGGRNANYRTWYFAAFLDLEAGDGSLSPGNTAGADGQTDSADLANSAEAQGSDDFQLAEERWQRRMRNMLPQERVRQLALYLLCWGEANQVRFMPECLCFIFKCAEDSFMANPSNNVPSEELSFLNHVITPIYRFLRDQGYEIRDGVYVHRERDHDKVVGYDDCNQLFWYPEEMRRIVLNDKTKLFDIPASQRLDRFKDINWGKSFFKTYKESRSLLHLLVNFNRIWIIPLALFWFFTAFNVPTLIVGPSYEQEVNQSPTNAKKLCAVGLGGAIAPFLQLAATITEWMHVPRRWPGAEPIGIKIVLLLVALVLNLAPGVKIFFFPGPKQLDDYLAMGHIALAMGHIALAMGHIALAMGHIALAIQLFAFLAIMPSGNLFGNFFKKKSRRATASEVFAANYPSLHGNNRVFSYLFWTLVFGAKFGESYVFLALSFRDPVRYLSIMNVDSCQGDKLFGAILCRQQPTILLVLMMITDLIFFFLDTYLWYVLVNTVCSILRSFYIGSSIWTPWRNIFYRLPKRIYSKVLATGEMDIKYKPKVLVSQNGEAERRISFFAQSPSTPIPEPMAVDSMPTFTVMIPHYSEKILFSLREIIREEDQYSRLTMLEYLKQLHPHEWSCFVRDTKALAGEDEPPDDSGPEATGHNRMDRKVQDLPFYFIGILGSRKRTENPHLGFTPVSNSLSNGVGVYELHTCYQVAVSGRESGGGAALQTISREA